MSHDAVIIGAGLNGLVAGIYLARAGRRVLVIERSNTPGGAVRTAEVTLPGFRHDLYATNLSLFAGSAFFREFRGDLERHGLEFAAASLPFSSVFPDGSWLGVSTDASRTCANIARVSQNDSRAWEGLSRDFPDVAARLFPLLAERMPSLALARAVLRNSVEAGPGWLLKTLKLLTASPGGLARSHFSDPRTQSLVAAWGMHLDFAPGTPGGGLFSYLESMAEQAFGMVIGKGGADTIIKAACALLRELGGKIALGTEAKRIEVRNGRAVAVATDSGLLPAETIIANLTPRILFGGLVPENELPASFVRRVRRFRYGPGTMMIHLALDDAAQWRAGPELSRYAYVHVAPYLEDMQRTYEDSLAGLLPANPLLVVAQPTAIDPARAPAGKHVLSIQVRTLPARIRGDVLQMLPVAPWEEVKERYAERVLDKLEDYAPGTRARILGRCVLSPDDLERDNPNLVGGCNLGGSQHLSQNYFMRPLAGWSTYRTPVRGLYMVGASTWPGGGTGAGSGRLLGMMLAGG